MTPKSKPSAQVSLGDNVIARDGRRGTAVSRMVVTHQDSRPDEVNIVVQYTDQDGQVAQAWFAEETLEAG